MKKLRIIYALIFSVTLFFAIPLNAAADFGPKPSVSISFRNAGGQTCYSAILARGSFQPSLGELVTEDAYSTEWFGELTPQEQEAVRAFADYAGRSAPDGYALFNRLWDVSRENVEMTYLAGIRAFRGSRKLQRRNAAYSYRRRSKQRQRF